MGKAQAKPGPVRSRGSLTARRLHAAQIRAETASSRSARKGRPRTLLRNLQRDSNGQCPCELRQVGRDGVPAVRNNTGHTGLCPSPKVPWKGPRPRGPEGKADHRRLYGTCNDARWPDALANSARSGGTASPPSATISGAEDCAPPGHRSTVGILRHWPAREGPRPRGPLEAACNSLPVASRCTGHPACCSGKKAPGCFCGHQPPP
jgi:hypothetical protein